MLGVTQDAWEHGFMKLLEWHVEKNVPLPLHLQPPLPHQGGLDRPIQAGHTPLAFAQGTKHPQTVEGLQHVANL